MQAELDDVKKLLWECIEAPASSPQRIPAYLQQTMTENRTVTPHTQLTATAIIKWAQALLQVSHHFAAQGDPCAARWIRRVGPDLAPLRARIQSDTLIVDDVNALVDVVTLAGWAIGEVGQENPTLIELLFEATSLR